MSSQGNGPPLVYQVHLSDQKKSILKKQYVAAAEVGIGKQFLSALRFIYERLGNDPLGFGESLYRLPALELVVCQAIVLPLVVDYAVHEEKRLVFIRGFKVLS